LSLASKKIATQSVWGNLALISGIIALGMIKELLSDYKRHAADKQTNETRHRRVVGVDQSAETKDVIKEVRKRFITFKSKDGARHNYYSNEVLCQDVKVGDLLVLQDD